MGIDDFETRIKIRREYFEKLKKGELTKENFYTLYELILNDDEREIKLLQEEFSKYKTGIIHFKRGFVGLAKKLAEIESDWFNFIEVDKKYFGGESFAKQIKEHDEMQKRIEERKKENQQT